MNARPAHSERAHALLGASKASQWINCPPSARLQETIPDRRSEYADEGTVAHELAEIKLRQMFDSAKREELEQQLASIKANKFYGAEMENAIQSYVETVEERYMAAKARSEDAVLLLEEQLDFSEWVPDGYGTGDVVIIADGVLDSIDLKYGKGIPVSAINNPQLRLYGLGAYSGWSFLYGLREIHMTIIQPRLDNISTDTIAVDELLKWAETVVKPAAALAFKGEGEFKPGDHCRFCKVKATCRARADENMKALAHEFREPALMDDDEIGSILTIAEELAKWAKDVQDYAFDRAVHGHRIPQFKLVEGRSNRQFADKDAVRRAFESAGLKPEQYLKPQELLGIGDLEKQIGKKEFAALVGDLIVKPQSKPVLVPETDRRPEINSLDSDFANENFELE